jgi:osmotically-inducible protein OsmY
MYFLDPERGRRRRALVRDKVAHAANLSSGALGSLGRDLSHRCAGLAARTRGAMRRRPVDDDVLIERVRAKLGRVVSHPHAIAVNATNGSVRLRGTILESEVSRLMRTVSRIRGVRGVDHELERLNVWQRG